MNNKESTIIVSVFLISLVLPFFGSEKENDNNTPTPPPRVVVDRNYRYAGAFVYGINHEKGEENNEDDENRTCKCGGKGYLIHGDGHRTPCPCRGDGGECKCSHDGSAPTEKPEQPPAQPKQKPDQQSQKAEPKKSKNVFLIFTATWCRACNEFKANELPKLEKLGLSYSEPRDGKITEIELVDIDKFPDIYNEWRKSSIYIPLFVLSDRMGNEYIRLEGYTTAQYLYELWQKYDK